MIYRHRFLNAGILTIYRFSTEQDMRKIPNKSDLETTFADIADSDVFAKFYEIIKELTGIKITLTDGYPSTTVKWMFSPENMTPLCLAVRSTEEGRRRCSESDRQHSELAIKNACGMEYICHAGLVDFIVPIFSEDKLLALIVGGQILPNEPNEKGFVQIKRHLKSLNIDPIILKKAYFSCPFLPRDKMRNVMDLFLLFSQYICEMGLRLKSIKKIGYSNAIIEDAKLYLEQHFREQISLNDMAQYLIINPSYLSVLFTKATGINLMAYLQQIRVDEAKRLLVTTTFSATKIALSVGFGDLTHFYRVFRKFENCTPIQYRKLHHHFT